MPHYRSLDSLGYDYHGIGAHSNQTDTFEFADNIGGEGDDPANQPPATAPKAPTTGDSFFYTDPQPREGLDTPPAELGDDFVI